jgi:hypothetical protein
VRPVSVASASVGTYSPAASVYSADEEGPFVMFMSLVNCTSAHHKYLDTITIRIMICRWLSTFPHVVLTNYTSRIALTLLWCMRVTCDNQEDGEGSGDGVDEGKFALRFPFVGSITTTRRQTEQPEYDELASNE